MSFQKKILYFPSRPFPIPINAARNPNGFLPVCTSPAAALLSNGLGPSLDLSTTSSPSLYDQWAQIQICDANTCPPSRGLLSPTLFTVDIIRGTVTPINKYHLPPSTPTLHSRTVFSPAFNPSNRAQAFFARFFIIIPTPTTLPTTLVETMADHWRL